METTKITDDIYDTYSIVYFNVEWCEYGRYKS